MSDETGLTEQEQWVEALLGRLHPTDDRAMRDKIIFQAGRASAGRVWMWRSMSGVLAMLFLCTSVIRTVTTPAESVNPTPQWTARDVESLPGRTSSNRTVMDDQAYIRVRSRVLTEGLDALPDMRQRREVASDSMSYGDALKRWMHM